MGQRKQTLVKVWIKTIPGSDHRTGLVDKVLSVRLIPEQRELYVERYQHIHLHIPIDDLIEFVVTGAKDDGYTPA